MTLFLDTEKLQDVKKWKKKDPIDFSKKYLIKNKIFKINQIEQLRQKNNKFCRQRF